MQTALVCIPSQGNQHLLHEDDDEEKDIVEQNENDEEDHGTDP